MSRSEPLPARSRGFTLVEVLITLVVVALLAVVALPAFKDSIRKSRRSEAFAALSAVQQAQERWRSTRPAYASELTALPTDDPPGLGLPDHTPTNYYGIALSGAGATGYVATATGSTGTSQAEDGQCVVLGVRVAGGNISYGSGASTIDWTDPNRCWAR